MGVAGTGRLGREHVRILAALPGVDGVTCYDTDRERSVRVAAEFGADAVESLEELLDRSDAVSIVAPTRHHADIALPAISHGADLFIEKPIAATMQEAEAVVSAAKSAGRIVQVGHVERFNPAFEAAQPLIVAPSFMEIERLSPFTLRGADVSVVMDLMIHDLDLVLMIVGEWPCEVRAKGAGVLTQGPDIVNVRLEFPGGCVANVTASRVSMEPSRKFRIFSPSHYLSIDLMERRVKYFKKSERFYQSLAEIQRRGADGGHLDLGEFLDTDEITAAGEEPLKAELNSFLHAVTNRARPQVSGEDGLRVLRLATEILAAMKVEPVI